MINIINDTVTNITTIAKLEPYETFVYNNRLYAKLLKTFVNLSNMKVVSFNDDDIITLVDIEITVNIRT